MSQDTSESSVDYLCYAHSDTDEPCTETLQEIKSTADVCFRTYCQHLYRFVWLDALEESVEDLDSPRHLTHLRLGQKRVSSRDMFYEGVFFQTLSTRCRLRSDRHKLFLQRYVRDPPKALLHLDASQPWILYWISHSLRLLLPYISFDTDELFTFLKKSAGIYLDTMVGRCDGGFGGGPNQLSHLATTYAALASLIELELFDYLNSLDRQRILSWLKSLRDEHSGGFFVHKDGELDVRGAYCAAAIAVILNLPTDVLFDGIDSYISSLQGFDGGLGGSPGQESHGGHSYCGLACLALLQKAHMLDLDHLLFWAVQRQTSNTGGFQGRPNKLHDSCYSFWCAAIIQIVHQLLGYSDLGTLPPGFNAPALQMYILGCCQEDVDESMSKYKGGLRDKPGASPDLYHTCYALSGLSIATHSRRSSSEPHQKALASTQLQSLFLLLNVTEISWSKWLARRTP